MNAQDRLLVADSQEQWTAPDVVETAEARKNRLQIFLASFLGTVVEWYDFFLYGFLTPLVFNELFFPKLSGVTAMIAVYATFAIGYASRPLGGLIFGHFGDRIGRKVMMQITLVLMGLSTALIGLLPTASQVGSIAPILLVILRFTQGFALGGESAASALMVLESAKKKQRGLAGGLLQCAAPVGVLSASLAVFAVTHMEHHAMLTWGWRVPFVASALLVVVGVYVRTKIRESENFAKTEPGQSRLPIMETLRDYKLPVFVVLAVSVMESTFYYLVTTFSVGYMTRTLHLASSLAIGANAAAAALVLVTSPLFGLLSDRIGRKSVFILGIVATAIYINFFFGMLDTKSPTLVVIAVVVAVGLVHCPMYALFGTFYGELFPTRVRFTGFSLGKALGTALGGGIAPMIAATLVASDGSSSIGLYYLGPVVLAVIAVLLCKETRNLDVAR